MVAHLGNPFRSCFTRRDRCKALSAETTKIHEGIPKGTSAMDLKLSAWVTSEVEVDIAMLASKRSAIVIYVEATPANTAIT